MFIDCIDECISQWIITVHRLIGENYPDHHCTLPVTKQSYGNNTLWLNQNATGSCT